MEFKIEIKPDEKGYTGRECPKCEKYFKIRFGTGIEADIPFHHLLPLSGKGAKKNPDPKKDMIPVCPNCHAMLHMQNPPMDWEELKRRMAPT